MMVGCVEDLQVYQKPLRSLLLAAQRKNRLSQNGLSQMAWAKMA